MSARPETETPPAVRAAEGERIAVGANAAAPYTPTGADGNVNLDSRQRPPKRVVSASRALRRAQYPIVTFCDSTGRKWAYGGKRGRVLDMLASKPGGVTQLDTVPWHTRLGGTIHAMRRDGLEISTELEGPYRHARYRLCTVGNLIIQAETGKEPVNIHREAP